MEGNGLNMERSTVILTIAGTNAPHTAMALQAQQTFLFRACEKSLLLVLRTVLSGTTR
jgi:hypothetical protein